MEKVIKSEKQYNSALETISRLIDLNPKPGSQEADEIDLLGVLLKEYESTNYPVDLPDPVDALEFYMEHRGITRKNLEDYLGSRSRVAEILSRKRTLTLPMIRSLNKGLGIPADLLIRETIMAKLEWNKFPLKEMIKRNWISVDLKTALEDLENILSDYIEPAGGAEAVLLRRTKFINSARKMDEYALWAWTARIIRIALASEPALPSFSRESLTIETMTEIAQLSVKSNGPVLAQNMLKDLGVSLVIECHLPKTYLDGATIVKDIKHPIIGLTLRFDRIDHFWFTLMHELAHLVLHKEDTVNTYFDDLKSPTEENRIEKEADELALNALFPNNSWENSIVPVSKSPISATMLAKDLNIHPAIVAGRVRKEYNRYRHKGLTALVGHGLLRRQFPEFTCDN